MREHVAIIGLIDLMGDGKDNTAELVRNLTRQGIIVDAYLDLKDKTLKNGNAHHCFVQGRRTTNAIVTHRKPLVLTDRFLLERRLSRKSPRLLILRPKLRSRVSSITISTVPPARTKVCTSTCSSLLLTASGDQRARLST